MFWNKKKEIKKVVELTTKEKTIIKEYDEALKIALKNMPNTAIHMIRSLKGNDEDTFKKLMPKTKLWNVFIEKFSGELLKPLPNNVGDRECPYCKKQIKNCNPEECLKKENEYYD